MPRNPSTSSYIVGGVLSKTSVGAPASARYVTVDIAGWTFTPNSSTRSSSLSQWKLTASACPSSAWRSWTHHSRPAPLGVEVGGDGPGVRLEDETREGFERASRLARRAEPE